MHFFPSVAVVFRKWLLSKTKEDGSPLYDKNETEAYVSDFPRQLSARAIALKGPAGVNRAVLQARQEGRCPKEARQQYLGERAAAKTGDSTTPSPKSKRQYVRRGTPGTVLEQRQRNRRRGKSTSSNDSGASSSPFGESAATNAQTVQPQGSVSGSAPGPHLGAGPSGHGGLDLGGPSQQVERRSSVWRPGIGGIVNSWSDENVDPNSFQ